MSKAKQINIDSAAEPVVKAPKQPKIVAPDRGANVPSNIVYGGPTPWHGFGASLEPNESVESAIERAGLNFEVAVGPISYGFEPKREEESFGEYAARIKSGGAGNPTQVNDYRQALYRTDDGHLLDVVGGGYVPIQNRDILQMFSEFVKQDGMRMDTLGNFQHGRKNWALVDMGEGFSLGGNDTVLGKVLFYFPHVYGQGAVYKTTSIRVVCSNTLQASLRQKSEHSFKIWHNRAFDEVQQQEAKARLTDIRKEFLQLKADAETLAAVKLSLSEAKALTAFVLGDVTSKFEDQVKPVHKVFDLYTGAGRGSSLPAADGTAWGLLNAVTEYCDWSYGNAKTSQSYRLERSWFGQGNMDKNKARKHLMTFAEKGMDGLFDVANAPILA